MSYPVTYYCPRCGTLHELDREGYLADKTVTPYPLEGWEYAAADEAFEDGAADGVRIVCGDDELLAEGADDGCGEPFYLSFVRFEEGEEVDPRAPSEYVELGEGASGPRGPSGPSFR